MADATILNGDIGVDYLANNRQKRMYWIGGTNSSYTMNQLYSEMATLLDETTTIDSGTAFSAETPVEYTTGKIDSGDTEPWYISFDLMEHITGGALRTSGWERVVGTNTGIVMVPVVSGGAIVAGDAGNDIVSDTDNDQGTLLEVIVTGTALDYLIIRPDDSTAGNSFDNNPTAGDTLTCNAHQSTQSTASTTGEQIWANLYSIGTIDSNVHIYLYQGVASNDASRTRVYSWNDATQDWYSNGHIDICVALKDITQSTWAIVDSGYISVFARKYGDLYASFEVATSTTAGGRNPIPLQTADDLDNTSGIYSVTTQTVTGGPYITGEIISGDTSLARAIVTSYVVDTSLTYIPIDDPQLTFQDAELITGATSNATTRATAAPAATGPSLNTWFTSNVTPTVTFTATTFDIDDNGVDENYGITIDCKSNPLTQVYEWIKYATRNGETTNDLDGINGERYIGGDVYLSFTGTVTGAVAEGGDVTQTGTGATGVIVAYSAANKVLLLRDSRGTFDTSGLITDNDNGGTFYPDDAAVTFAPKTASPLGTFAGGTFFGARGVLLSNWISADENSFILTPIEGGTKERPQAISITVTNLVGGAPSASIHDRVSVYRLDADGGNIDKDEYRLTGSEVPSSGTVTVSGSIAQDVPGKSTGGSLVIVDDLAGIGAEYAIRFSSWTGSVFTLATLEVSATDGTTTATQLQYSPGGFSGNVLRGDLLYNVTQGGTGYVKTVDSDTQLTLEGEGITGQTTGDQVWINAVPITTTTDDYLYVPLINKIATTSSESVSIIYVSTIYFRVRVRNTRAAIKIKPYSSDGSTSGTDQSIPVIRTTDTIIT